MTNYHCKADALFGELSEPFQVRDVTFRGDFGAGELANCHVRATPGPNGQGNVNCPALEGPLVGIVIGSMSERERWVEVDRGR